MDEPRKQVLCVDDEPDITYRMKRFVERHYPIDVQTADNGYMALGMLSQHHFDAVILDVSMPGINGLEVTAEIIKLYPQTIVIIITGSGDHESLSRAKGARFLIKPVAMEEIKTLIYQHFGLMAT
jgi:DNA-binding NtrC family response regulator